MAETNFKKFEKWLIKNHPLPVDVKLSISRKPRKEISFRDNLPCRGLFETDGKHTAKITVASDLTRPNEDLRMLGHEYYHGIQTLIQGKYLNNNKVIDWTLELEANNWANKQIKLFTQEAL